MPHDEQWIKKWCEHEKIDPATLTDIREYGDDFPVTLDWNHMTGADYKRTGERRLCITAVNEGGYNSTAVDLLDLIAWVKKNKPELLAGLS